MMNTAEGFAEGHRIDAAGAKMGMWIFLFTEVLFFGGLFLIYTVYRVRYGAAFHQGGRLMDTVFGIANTAILLTGSLTIALSIALLRKGKRGLSLLAQGLTVLMGVFFLADKYVEYSAHIGQGLYPASPELLSMDKGKIIFIGLYYVMTGVHALHVLIGVAVIFWTFLLTARQKITPRDTVILENTGLYWHFVDVIWIYLLPLFYLIT